MSLLVTDTQITKNSTYITNHGTFRHDSDLLAARMLQLRKTLLAEVIERCADSREPGMHASDYRKLRKGDLAAMLADFDTGTRENALSMISRHTSNTLDDIRCRINEGRDIVVAQAASDELDRRAAVIEAERRAERGDDGTRLLLDADGTVTIRVPLRYIARVAEQTARYDASVRVEPGTYTMRPTTIDGLPTTFEDAYYFASERIPAVLVSGGYPDELLGTTARSYSFRQYGYAVRATLAASVTA